MVEDFDPWPMVGRDDDNWPDDSGPKFFWSFILVLILVVAVGVSVWQSYGE